jgi:hypothetical protein
MKNRDYALSLKQPWATLLVHGLKTIEVRRWPTARRGRILIHAARIADERPDAWKHVPEALQASAELLGGIVGAAQLVDCRSYRTLDDFLKDQTQHLNEPDWYEAGGLFGFSFAEPEVLDFRKYPGWMRFFPVETGPFARKQKPTP